MVVFVAQAIRTIIRIKHFFCESHNWTLGLFELGHNANSLDQQILITMHFHSRISSTSDRVPCKIRILGGRHFNLASVSSNIWSIDHWESTLFYNLHSAIHFSVDFPIFGFTSNFRQNMEALFFWVYWFLFNLEATHVRILRFELYEFILRDKNFILTILIRP